GNARSQARGSRIAPGKHVDVNPGYELPSVREDASPAGVSQFAGVELRCEAFVLAALDRGPSPFPGALGVRQDDPDVGLRTRQIVDIKKGATSGGSSSALRIRNIGRVRRGRESYIVEWARAFPRPICCGETTGRDETRPAKATAGCVIPRGFLGGPPREVAPQTEEGHLRLPTFVQTLMCLRDLAHSLAPRSPILRIEGLRPGVARPFGTAVQFHQDEHPRLVVISAGHVSRDPFVRFLGDQQVTYDAECEPSPVSSA